MDVKLIVGLEIHVHLATNTKMFCGCRLGYDDPPNTNVCPVCLGMPGSLPVINKQAYIHSVRTALALNCSITKFTKWDRKSYYYPDLPKNYQISQYDLPMSEHGYMDIPLGDGKTKRIRILRAHLEEDAGKNLHEGLGHSQVDLNRAGSPLLEIVTEPDLNSAEECRILAMELQKLVQFIGASHGDMQKGHMRFEPNINLHITEGNNTYKTPICEVKNLNSFRAVEGAVAYEEWRHLEEWKMDHDFVMEKQDKQNRGWDDVKKETVFQRGKEEAHDYRYFPDPDLVPVVIDGVWLEEIKSTMGELPAAMKERFISDYGLNDYDAMVLTGDKATATFFDDAVKAGAKAKIVTNIVTQYGLSIANEKQVALDQIGVSSAQVADLAKLIDDGTINSSAAKTIFEKMLTEDGDPKSIAEKHNLIQVSDTSALEGILDQVLADNQKAVEDFRAGGKKAPKSRGFLLGQVMQKSKGQANPKVVGDLLDAKLNG